MRPYYVVAPVENGMAIDKDLLKLATRVLFVCGHEWAQVHVAHESQR